MKLQSKVMKIVDCKSKYWIEVVQKGITFFNGRNQSIQNDPTATCNINRISRIDATQSDFEVTIHQQRIDFQQNLNRCSRANMMNTKYIDFTHHCEEFVYLFLRRSEFFLHVEYFFVWIIFVQFFQKIEGDLNNPHDELLNELWTFFVKMNGRGFSKQEKSCQKKSRIWSRVGGEIKSAQIIVTKTNDPFLHEFKINIDISFLTSGRRNEKSSSMLQQIVRKIIGKHIISLLFSWRQWTMKGKNILYLPFEFGRNRLNWDKFFFVMNFLWSCSVVLVLTVSPSICFSISSGK